MKDPALIDSLDSPEFKRFLNTLDEQTYESLSEQQLKAISDAILKFSKPRIHKLDFRKTFSIPFVKLRFYGVFFLGVDRRDLKTREKEIAQQAYIVMGATTLLAFILLSFVGLYVLKIAFGIDLFNDVSLGGNNWLNSLDN